MANLVPTPTIDKFGEDLTAKARRGEIDPVIGRDKEIIQAIEVLLRRQKNNPVFIGEPGVGKTALANGLALLIASGQAPKSLENFRIVSISFGSIVAGTKFRGDFEARMKMIIEEAEKCPNLILFIDELHTVVKAGGSDSGMSGGDLLKPALARGKLKVVGATTLDEYREHIEKDPAFERRFEPIILHPPNKAETLAILKGLREKYEEHHKLKISDEALEAAVELSERYLAGDRFQPDLAITLMDTAAAMVRLRNDMSGPDPRMKELEKLKADKAKAVADEEFEKAGALQIKIGALETVLRPQKLRDGKPLVTREDIIEKVSQKTGIPLSDLSVDEAAKLLGMEEELDKRLIGQKQATKALGVAVRKARAGLKDPNRPVGSFLFAGPTGVGKTLLVKELARFMFGDPNAVIRLDMSEYMEKNSVNRIHGAPPGYVGYEEGGQLTEKVRRKPYSVVLLDELEKAHPDVLNLLLQIMEDGHLTDNKGRKVDFKNTIIIMTTNEGAQRVLSLAEAAKELREQAAAAAKPVADDGGFGLGIPKTPEAIVNPPPVEDVTYEKMKEEVMADLRLKFRPEMLNRLDDIIVFRTLDKEDQVKVVTLELLAVSGRLKTNKGISLDASEEAKKFLCEMSTADIEGGRALRRIVEQKVETPVSEGMLRGNFAGAKRIHITLEGKGADRKLKFEPVAE